MQLTSKRAKPDATANGDRRKGMPWSEEEHRLFLLGLGKFGKGDWRSIARNFVITRTPTQVSGNVIVWYCRQHCPGIRIGGETCTRIVALFAQEKPNLNAW